MDQQIIVLIAAFATGFAAARVTSYVQHWEATQDRNQKALEWMI